MPFTFSAVQKAVAVFILTGIALLLVLVVLIGKGSYMFTLKNYYYTYIKDAGGLSIGMPIRYKGIAIGQVKDINLISETNIIMRVAIFRKYSYLVKSNSVLKISKSLLGSSSIDLITSDSEVPVLKNGSLIYSSDMEEGQKILITLYKQPAVGETQELTEKLSVLIDNILQLRPMIDQILLNLQETIRNLNDILLSFKGTKETPISQEILKTLENIKYLSEQLKIISQNLSSTNNTVGAIITDKGEIYKNLLTSLYNINSILSNINHLTMNLRGTPEDVKEVMRLVKEDLRLLNMYIRNLPFMPKAQIQETPAGGR